MTWLRLTKTLTTVLALSFPTAVHGASTCLTGASSQCAAGTSDVYFANCAITDDDIADLNSCLTTIGRHLITDLDLSQNELTTIPPGLFNGMDVLTQLSLEENAITAVPAGLFTNLGSLELLRLGTNTIATIDADAFMGLDSLQKLGLEENVFTTLQASAFDHLGTLEDLLLQRNDLAVIDVDAFAGLVSLKAVYLNGNEMATVQAGLFSGSPSLETVWMQRNSIATVETGAFANLASLQEVYLHENQLTTVQAGLFADLTSLRELRLNKNSITTIDEDAFTGLTSLQVLYLYENQLTAVQAGLFVDLASLRELWLNDNSITTIGDGAFTGLTSLQMLELNDNALASLPVDVFSGLPKMEKLLLNNNALTTLPAGIFETIGSTSDEFETLNLDGNVDLQCVPTVVHASAYVDLPTTDELCECIPAAAVTCGTDEVCTSGAVGYNCVPACTEDMDCDTDNGEECCPLTGVCGDPADFEAGACGDPHMTGFRGQTFDFTGKDGAWYAVVSDLPYMHLNMRVTSPVPSVPEITYITGISMVTTDDDGLGHTIIISVADPHNLESSCRAGMSSCLADGALEVVVDGKEVLISPGEVTVAPGVTIASVNLPGACRSFGFDKYWERKKLEMLAQADRRLSLINTMQDMSDWVLSDPTATNMAECAEYVAGARVGGEVGLFGHQSEHASFQIMTPTIKLRLGHGRLHQIPMRDATDTFDLPDHLTWQMNMAIDHADISLDATGILGETLVPTVDTNGTRIMKGMHSIRGMQEDYRVKGPLGVIFAQGQHQE